MVPDPVEGALAIHEVLTTGSSSSVAAEVPAAGGDIPSGDGTEVVIKDEPLELSICSGETT